MYEPVPPKQVIGQLALRFQSSCEQAEAELTSISSSSTTEVLVTLVDSEEILRRALLLVRQAQQTLAVLASAFINIEYYFLRMSNEHPAVLQRVLWQVVEPEDVERYTFHFDFLAQRISEQHIEK